MHTDATPNQQLVVFVVFDGIKLLDLAGPLQVFSDTLDPVTQKPYYTTLIASQSGGPITTDTCVTLPTHGFSELRHRALDTLLVAGGDNAWQVAMDTRLSKVVAQYAQRARRTGAICTGAFILAAAGLLDGKRAVTHWQSCARLASAYANVHVEADPIFINDSDVWTSAGVTAGIDLALAMVAEDLGRETALTLARELVSYMVRPGGQKQFSAMLRAQSSDTGGRFDELHDWLGKNLQRELSVTALAEHVHMSPRTFSRIYSKNVGQTPGKALETLRLEAACRLLEESNVPVSIVAKKCGLQSAERMRRAFLRVLHVSPSDYRLRFKRV